MQKCRSRMGAEREAEYFDFSSSPWVRTHDFSYQYDEEGEEQPVHDYDGELLGVSYRVREWPDMFEVSFPDYSLVRVFYDSADANQSIYNFCKSDD